MLLVLQLLNLLSSGGGGGGDTTPNAFSFTDDTGATPNAVLISNSITVSGVDPATPIAINVTGGEYSVNGGAFTSTAGSVVLGDTVRARGTASSSYSTAVNIAVTIGGVSDTYTITTQAAPPPVTPGTSGLASQRNLARRFVHV